MNGSHKVPATVNSRLRLLLCGFLLFLSAAVSVADAPNIIFILTDDLGYGDLGVNHQDARAEAGLPAFDTPELDTLAAQGARLTRHYCGAPVCAPSRASLLTGMHQGHATVRDNQFDKALEDAHTLGSVLRQAGYATAAIGKWGLGGSATAYPAHPMNRGFDYYFGVMEHGQAHAHYLPEAGHALYDGKSAVKAGYEKCYSTDLFTARAKKWITDQQTDHPDQPFFLYLAYTAPHARLQVPTQAYPAGSGLTGGLQWQGSPGEMINTASGTNDSWIHPDFASTDWPEAARRHATMVRRVDTAVGDLLDLLDDLGVGEDTLIVFSADNGPHHEAGRNGTFTQDPTFFQSYGNLDGTKRDLWEGGWRVPTLVHWPEGIPAGQVVNRPSQFHDWLATFAAVAGAEIPARVDGVSLLPDLTGSGNRTGGVVYAEYAVNGSTKSYDDFLPARRGRTRNQMQALYAEGEKGVRYNVGAASDPFAVYDTGADPGESVNRSGQPDAPSQDQLRAAALRVRRINSSATRVYDSAHVPALESTSAGWPAVSVYTGDFPWTPRPAGTPDRTVEEVQVPSVSMLHPLEEAALVFEGILNVPTTGDYEFFVRADLGAVARLHGMLLADSDPASGAWVSSGTVRLEQGVHPLWLYSRHGPSSPYLDLEWTGPGFSRQPVPTSAFDPELRDNTPPVIEIDSPLGGALLPEGHGLRVRGSVSDDGAPADSSLSVVWTAETVPPGASVTFTPGDTVNTRVRMDQPGRYVLRCTASDGTMQTATDLEVVSGVLRQPPSPALWYPLQSSFQDAAGTNHASAQSGTQFVTGVLDGAVELDAAGEYFETGNPVSITQGSAWSFSVWFQLDHTSAGNAMILQQLDGDATGRSWLYVTPGNALGSFIGGGSTSGGQLLAGAWHHAAVVAGAGQVTLYLNGVPVSEQAGRTLEANNGIFRFGNFKTVDADSQFFGRLEQAALYARALTGDEIARLAAAGQDRGPELGIDLPEDGISHIPFSLEATVTDSGTPELAWFSVPSDDVKFQPANAAETSVTLPAAGTYTLGLEADDGIQTSFIEDHLPALTPTMVWRRTHFGSTENSGVAADDADPNANGRPNLFERALGTDPTAAGGVELPRPEVVWVDGSPVPAIRFQRPSGGTESPSGEYRFEDLVLEVRGGGDLRDATNWPALEMVPVSIRILSPELEEVVLRIPDPPTGITPYFLQLSVQADP
ncbi:sulfatase-like hydrolase/transferase [Kiritimatiellaeota bacterium B1221]|nr:sulfatase-like hydrolase/transferase [Kiritimatiellaeota bacterium B1221]